MESPDLPELWGRLALRVLRDLSDKQDLKGLPAQRGPSEQALWDPPEGRELREPLGRQGLTGPLARQVRQALQELRDLQDLLGLHLANLTRHNQLLPVPYLVRASLLIQVHRQQLLRSIRRLPSLTLLMLFCVNCLFLHLTQTILLAGFWPIFWSII